MTLLHAMRAIGRNVHRQKKAGSFPVTDRTLLPCQPDPAGLHPSLQDASWVKRTLVPLAASTGLRQSEIFGLKWGDIDFERGTMSVIRSIVYGVVDPCKTESSQKPVPMHPTLADALTQWRKRSTYIKPEDWVFASRRYRGRRPYWGQAILRKYIPCSATSRNSESIRMAYVPAHLLDPAAKRGD